MSTMTQEISQTMVDLTNLCSLARDGNADAVRDLFSRFQSALIRAVRSRIPRKLRNYYDSTDVVQSVWLSFFAKKPNQAVGLLSEENLKAYLMAMTRNKLLEEYRRRTTQKYNIHREDRLFQLRGDQDNGAEAIYATDPSPSEYAQADDCLRSMTKHLPEPSQKVVVLRGQGYTFEEIAEQVGMHPQTARKVVRELKSWLNQAQPTQTPLRTKRLHPQTSEVSDASDQELAQSPPDCEIGENACEWWDDSRLIREQPIKPRPWRIERSGPTKVEVAECNEANDLPDSGHLVGPYRLLREIGRGAYARVFLAKRRGETQQYVLKLTTRDSAESALLGKTNHPHIVKILESGTLEDGAIHYIAMPFLGGATLASILERASETQMPRNGAEFLELLDQSSTDRHEPITVESPDRERLAQMTYIGAVVSIVAKVALALQHAHLKGVIHGDIKPANILITSEGSPILLDFNLAVEAKKPCERSWGGGGTLPYMAPELLRVYASSTPWQIPKTLDRRLCDIYSLGLILMEALSGERPALPESTKSIKEFANALANQRSGKAGCDPESMRRFPVRLRQILARCLAPSPNDRYRQAEDLARDLSWFQSEPPTRMKRSRRAGTYCLEEASARPGLS